MKRVFLIVLDSLGAGAAPDAAAFGDAGCGTLQALSRSKSLHIGHLLALGLGNIDGLDCFAPTDAPRAAVARMTETSMGKDTTIGHWEIAGVISPRPLPTYPDGFPDEVLDAFRAATGRGVLCNKPYSGTDVIRDFGPEHVRTGDLIVYTSADSVFQIAAHEDVVAPEQLYTYCRAARAILTGPHAVGRIIARPFEGEFPYARTARRHDFSLLPPGETVLDAVQATGQAVISVGKISDIFAGRGVTRSIPTVGNSDGMDRLLELAGEDFTGLCFANLVDFDMLYGHRNNTDGYAKALTQFDGWLPGFLKRLGPEDCVLLTADHGCDPSDVSTDHTREYTPLLVYGPAIRPVNLGTRKTFADIAATAAQLLGVPYAADGQSFADEIL